MNWIEDIFREKKRLLEITDDLYELANGFETTGNERVARNLCIMANQIADIEASIQKIVAKHVDDDCKGVRTSEVVVETALVVAGKKG